MRLRPFTSKHLYGLVIMAHMIAFVFTGQAQTIDTPVVSGTPVCAGSSVNITFVVTNGNGNDNSNGNGKEKYFSAATEYVLDLYRNDTLLTSPSITFNSTIAPAAGGGESATISYDFTIPVNSSFSTNYQVKISSLGPEPTGNTDLLFSLPFEIHGQITGNSITGDLLQSGCNPYTATAFSNPNVTGGNGSYAYLWESSTTGPDSGFSAAAGINDQSGYDPGVLNETTWFRCVVTSGMCSSISEPVKVEVSNENIWSGALDQDWNNPGNWSCGAVPIPATNVVIPSTPNDPVLQSGNPGTANNITVQADARLTITGNVLMIGGSISKAGTGILDAQNGKFSFVGDTVQNLAGSILLGNKLADLEVNNPSGLALNDPLAVTGSVLALNGNITSNGNLKLLSTPTRTALIDGSGTGDILGNVTMQRYLSSSYGYKYFSSPFQSLTVGAFLPYIDLMDPATGFPNFYNYNESRQSNGTDASGWEIYTDPSSPMVSGKGYAVNFGKDLANPVTVELTGTVFNSSLEIPVENNNGLYTKGFNLVGNPYASPVDWAQVGRTNVDDALYFFTAGNTDPYTGTYSSYIAGYSTDGTSSGIIPSMQGFFVKVSDPVDGTTPVSGSLQFSAGARVNNYSQDFYKRSLKTKEPRKLIRLQAGLKGSERKDPLLVYFTEDAKPVFESDRDALKIYNTDPAVPSFYSLGEDRQKLSINALPFSKELHIGLGIKADNGGELQIELSELQGLSKETEVHLLDMEKGTSTPLLAKRGYTCSIGPGDHEGRFFLYVFSNKEVEKLPEVPAALFTSFTQKGKLYVDLNLKEGEEGFLQLSNLQGQVLQVKKVSGKEQAQFKGLSNAGIYVVTLYHNGNRYARKVIIEK